MRGGGEIGERTGESGARPARSRDHDICIGSARHPGQVWWRRRQACVSESNAKEALCARAPAPHASVLRQTASGHREQPPACRTLLERLTLSSSGAPNPPRQRQGAQTNDLRRPSSWDAVVATISDKYQGQVQVSMQLSAARPTRDRRAVQCCGSPETRRVCCTLTTGGQPGRCGRCSIVDVEVLDMASTTVGSRALDLSNVPARRYKNPLH